MESYMNYTITVLPGDNIGPEVINEATKVLAVIGDRFGHVFDLSYGSIGGEAIDRFGTALPDETLDMCQNSDAILFGAVGGPKWDISDADTRPEDGILAVRKKLGLFANLRPIKVYPDLIASSPIKPDLLKGVDMIIVRELTGGLYFSKPKKRWTTSRGRRGVDTLKYSEHEVERILRVGFELARSRRKLLTSADKFNVLESSRLWREVAIEVSKDYPDVELEHIYVDNLSMKLIVNPSHFDVIVAENMFGDILSDEAAALVGSLGMMPSASLAGLPGSPAQKRGKLASLYEPIHGSAPDIVGRQIANPLGTILSVAMMLRHSFGLESEAKAVESAVDGVLAEGYRTLDIAGSGSESVTTVEMGDVIAGRI